MYVYVYVYIYIYIYIYMYMYISIYIYIYVCVCVHMYVLMKQTVCLHRTLHYLKTFAVTRCSTLYFLSSQFISLNSLPPI